MTWVEIKSRILYWLVLLILGGTTAYLGYIGVLTFYPYKVFEVQSPVEVLTTKVRPGDFIQYEIKYTKHKNITASVSKQIFYLDKNLVINLNQSFSYLPVGKNKIITVYTVQIPKYAPTGRAKIIITPVYNVNPFQTVSVPHETEPFEIVK